MKKSAVAWLFALLIAIPSLITIPSPSFAKVFVSVAVAPPPLPDYEQPIVPGPDYIWTPGYWAYDEEGWFWVAGSWVQPPEPDLLWTPGYWEWDDYGRAYVWHAGYWGPDVGFYGGVSYGYGYPGVGYYGGYWDHGVFWYNSHYSRIDRRYIRHAYSKPGTSGKTTNASHNGGPGWVRARPTQTEQESAKGRRFFATEAQVKQRTLAMVSKDARFSGNRGTSAPATIAGRDASRDASTVRDAASEKTPPVTFRTFGARPTTSARPDARAVVAPSPSNTPQLAARGDGNQRSIRPDESRAPRTEKSGARPDQQANGQNASTLFGARRQQSGSDSWVSQPRRQSSDDDDDERRRQSARRRGGGNGNGGNGNNGRGGRW